jgi:hypothetical protein
MKKIFLFLLISAILACNVEAKKEVKPDKAQEVEKQINELLTKNNLTLDVIGVFTINGNQFQIRVVPKPEEKKEKGKK